MSASSPTRKRLAPSTSKRGGAWAGRSRATPRQASQQPRAPTGRFTKRIDSQPRCVGEEATERRTRGEAEVGHHRLQPEGAAPLAGREAGGQDGRGVGRWRRRWPSSTWRPSSGRPPSSPGPARPVRPGRLGPNRARRGPQVPPDRAALLGLRRHAHDGHVGQPAHRRRRGPGLLALRPHQRRAGGGGDPQEERRDRGGGLELPELAAGLPGRPHPLLHRAGLAAHRGPCRRRCWRSSISWW